jgi:hypothetical protein
MAWTVAFPAPRPLGAVSPRTPEDAGEKSFAGHARHVAVCARVVARTPEGTHTHTHTHDGWTG